MVFNDGFRAAPAEERLNWLKAAPASWHLVSLIMKYPQITSAENGADVVRNSSWKAALHLDADPAFRFASAVMPPIQPVLSEH